MSVYFSVRGYLKKGWEFLLTVASVTLLGAILCLIPAIPIYLLWNWLMPEIFVLRAITFSQAWGIAWLTMLLFKGDVNVKMKFWQS